MENFQSVTRNNGLKNVEWGSDDFKKKVQTAETLKEEDDAMAHYYNAVMSIQGG